MAFFDDLARQSIRDLMAAFDGSAGTANDIPLEERDLWYQEAARRIAESGLTGLDFLLDHAAGNDAEQLPAVLLGLAFAGKEAVAQRRGRIRQVLPAHLTGAHPLPTAEAIDSLNSLGFTEIEDQLLPLLQHPSPYVVGSVLRFLSRHRPERAQPLLLGALASPEPIIRQNAVDELDELNDVAALPRLRGLLTDVDDNVRWAARTAVHDLEQSLRAKNPSQQAAQHAAGD